MTTHEHNIKKKSAIMGSFTKFNDVNSMRPFVINSKRLYKKTYRISSSGEYLIAVVRVAEGK